MPDPNAAMGVPGASPAPQALSLTAPPSGAPAADEQPASGEKEQAKANVQIALMLLEQTLPIIGSDGEEGKAILSAISTLAKKFGGQKSKDLAPAELMQMMASMPEEYKQGMSAGQGQPEGIPGGPHAPANLGV